MLRPVPRSIRPIALDCAIICALVALGGSPLLGQASDLDRYDRALQRLVAKVSPSVVSVRLVAQSEPAGEGTSVPGATRRVLYQGSGVIGGEEGTVLSIIARGKPDAELRPDERFAIEVTLDDGTIHGARWVAADPETGITLLAVEGLEGAANRPAPVRSATEPPARGATVIGIGSDGLQIGHVVHPARGVQLARGTFPRAIVTSIPAQAGDVGGLLANADGEMVGILAFSLATDEGQRPGVETGFVPGGRRLAHSSRESGAAGVGRAVAIPADLVDKIVAELRATGRMERGALGATFQFHHPALAGSTHYGAGALVREIVPGSAAETDGLQVGDVVQRVDGRDIHRAEDLLWFRERVEYGTIGERLSLEVARMEHRRVVSKTLSVRIGTRPDGAAGVPRAPLGGPSAGELPAPTGSERGGAEAEPPERRGLSPPRR